MYSIKLSLPFLLMIFLSFEVSAEKVLMYDNEKGIIFVDKDKDVSKKITLKQTTKIERNKPVVKKINSSKEDIHLHRKKDPPEIYFKSGLKYYRDENYKDALKNFMYATNKKMSAEYLLWIGKSHRKLEDFSAMIFTMNRIINDFPKSDVADDAIIELAIYYRNNSNYSKAKEFFTKFIEQYPFGKSYSTGEEYMEMARRAKRGIRGELLSALSIVGIKATVLEDGLSEFQKNSSLEITGKADSVTVSFLKEAQKIASMESLNKNSKDILIEKLAKDLTWVVPIGLIFLGINLIMLFIFFKFKNSKKEIWLLSELISDMKIGEI